MVEIVKVEEESELEEELLSFVEGCSWEDCKDHMYIDYKRCIRRTGAFFVEVFVIFTRKTETKKSCCAEKYKYNINWNLIKTLTEEKR